MSSNEPYSRVDDGIGSGLVSGSLMAGAATYGAHAYTKSKYKNSVQTTRKMRDYTSRMAERKLPDNLVKQAFDEDWSAKEQKSVNNLNKNRKNYRTPFGSGKRRAISYGLTGLLGAGLGAGIDAANN